MSNSNNKIHVLVPENKERILRWVDFLQEYYWPSPISQYREKILEKSRKIIESEAILEYDKISLNYCCSDYSTLKEKKRELIETQRIIQSKYHWIKSIVFIWDDCEPNKLFIEMLHRIFEEDFDKYVELKGFSYTDMSVNQKINDILLPGCIFILWWSYDDVDTVSYEIHNSEHVKFFLNQVENGNKNSRIIEICMEAQAKTFQRGIINKFSEFIATTYIWPGQFWLMPWKIIAWEYQVPKVYREALKNITNNWKNNKLYSFLTRTWHFDSDFFDSPIRLTSNWNIVILRDAITWSELITVNPNWKRISIQQHFEINPKKDFDLLLDTFIRLIPKLNQTYGDSYDIVKNLENIKNIDYNLADIFYTNLLLDYSKSIISSYDEWADIFSVYKWEWIKNQQQINDIISVQNFWDVVKNSDIIKFLDDKMLLKMSVFYDWKVNRWIKEASELLWLDLLDLIKYHYDKSNKNNYIIRDWWAWNWRLVNDIIKETWIHSYWVSDYAYFDIYESIKNIDKFNDIPENVIKLFTYELIEKYKLENNWTVYDIIKRILSKITLEDDSFISSSIFSEKTYHYSDEFWNINKEDREYIDKNYYRIDELKKYIIENFYEIIIWYFENLKISNFSEILPSWPIKQVNFQVAIRSTCHINSDFLEKNILNYMLIYAKPWSVYIDNWVMRSYIWEPRISEFIKFENNYNKDIKIYFIYDYNTSYITSAIILKKPFIEKEILEFFLEKDYKILTKDEINNCSFFKIERLFRELMIFVFRDVRFLQDNNKEIMNFLKELSILTRDAEIEELKSIIVNDIKLAIIWKIRTFIDKVNDEYSWVNYSSFNSNCFNFYLKNVQSDIQKIFSKSKINNPEWFNNDFERKN